MPESFDTVVAARARIADSTEGQGVLRKVNDDVIAHGAPGGCCLEQQSPLDVAITKIIKRQRFGSCVDVADGFGQAVVTSQQEHRTEDFVLRDLHLIGDAEHDRDRQFSGRLGK